MDEREPVRWLNYRRDVRTGVPPIMGPTLDGKPMFPVDAAYDAETDRTRVGLSFEAPEAVAP